MKKRFKVAGLLVTTLLLCLGLSVPVVWGLTCGNISGTVTDSTTARVASVTVNIYHAANHMLVETVSTNPDGSYFAYNLPAGSYKVEFDPSNTGGDYLKQWYTTKTDFSSANSVTVTAGDTTSDINAILNPGGSISGTVTGTTAPGGLLGVTVTIYDSSGAVVGAVSSNDNGSYIYTGLSAGSYKVRFNRDTAGCSEVIWYNAKSDITTADPVTVTVGTETTGIDAVFPTATIKGTVTSGVMPAFYASVVVHDAVTGNRVDSAMTSILPDGTNYQFNDLPPGSYKIKFSSPSPYTPFQYVTKWYNDKYSKATATPVDVTGGQTAIINTTLEQGGTISGTVKDSVSAAVIPGVNVIAYDSVTGEQPLPVVTNASGTYTLQGLRTGQSYLIRFLFSGYIEKWYDNKNDQATATPVPVPNTTPVTGIDAKLVA